MYVKSENILQLQFLAKLSGCENTMLITLRLRAYNSLPISATTMCTLPSCARTRPLPQEIQVLFTRFHSSQRAQSGPPGGMRRPVCIHTCVSSSGGERK